MASWLKNGSLKHRCGSCEEKEEIAMDLDYIFKHKINNKFNETCYTVYNKIT
jgi:hypothetical protein